MVQIKIHILKKVSEKELVFIMHKSVISLKEWIITKHWEMSMQGVWKHMLTGCYSPSCEWIRNDTAATVTDLNLQLFYLCRDGTEFV